MPASKFSPEKTAAIIASLRLCAPREVAAAAAGVSSRTLRNWLERDEPEYQEFARKVSEAEAIAEKALVTTLLKSAKDGDWRAAAWVLERRSGENWGYKQKLEHSGPDGGPIETKQSGVVMLPPEEPEDDGDDNGS